jgi:hypothetical protein
MAEAHPPRLRLRLVDRLRTLLLINVLPLLAGLGIAVLHWQGRIGIAMGQNELTVAFCAALAVACMVFVGWCMLPVLLWLRDYSSWHYQHGSALVWALPCAGAWLLWLGGLLLGLAIGLVMALALASAVWRLVEPPDRPEPADQSLSLGVSDRLARVATCHQV